MSSLLETFARIRFAAADVGERRTWSDGMEREKQGDGTWAKVDSGGGSGASGASNSVGGGYKETSKEVPGRDLSAMSMVDENAEWESQVEGKMGEAEGMGITGQDAQAWAEAVLSGDQGAADSIASQYGGGDPFGDELDAGLDPGFDPSADMDLDYDVMDDYYADEPQDPGQKKANEEFLDFLDSGLDAGDPAAGMDLDSDVMDDYEAADIQDPGEMAADQAETDDLLAAIAEMNQEGDNQEGDVDPNEDGLDQMADFSPLTPEEQAETDDFLASLDGLGYPG